MKAGLPLLALTLALAACAPAAKAPPVVTTTAPVSRPAPPRPAPPPLPAPADTHWMDAALTPGTWTYEDRGNLPLAVFAGRALFAMQCWGPWGNFPLFLRGPASPATIRTETADRTLALEDAGSEIPTAIAALDARDPLLDAMALSKGRFSVEVEGEPTLYLPSHAEVSRVIEDCRG
ncbi:MAG: hypothetical protein KAF27_07970 [Porphyrobacter sp.]|nr:hypothetical protein [Porphyrobacter sp.]